MIINQPQPTLI